MSARGSWIAFASVGVLSAAGLGYATRATLVLEHDANQARVYSDRQQRLRRALWQLDGVLSPIIASESARPPEHYRTLIPDSAGVLGASPILAGDLAQELGLARLHFELDAGGRLSSPEVPSEAARERILALGALSEKRIDSGANALRELAEALDYARLVETASLPPPAAPDFGLGPEEIAAQNRVDDFSQREQNMLVTREQRPARASQSSSVTALVPCVVELSGERRELLLVRGVTSAAGVSVQGIWTDWRRLRAWLVDQVAQLFPDATVDLLASTDEAPADPAVMRGRLAALPAMLVLLDLAEVGFPTFSYPRLALALAWAALAAALLAVAVVLRQALALSERRVRFARAVSHELRTPLTTFCLYSEMLADGLVRDERQRADYLSTLKREANRLRGIVESVLASAELERGVARPRSEIVPARDLIEQALPPLQARARAAGFELAVGALPESAVRADPHAVGQVLFNLVDNACKYAAEAPGRVIVLDASVRGAALEISIADSGPGVPREARARIFHPYERAAGPNPGPPGLGLGLSISRGLARGMGGDLTLAPVDPVRAGARFVLSLPLARTAGAG